MGIQFCFSSKPIMKSLLLVALAFAAVVVAEPEADAAADAWYGYYGHPGYYGYGRGYYGLGYASRYYGYGGYYGHPYRYGGYRYFGKRSADAEPEADASADAWYGYYGYGHRGYYGYGRPY